MDLHHHPHGLLHGQFDSFSHSIEVHATNQRAERHQQEAQQMDHESGQWDCGAALFVQEVRHW